MNVAPLPPPQLNMSTREWSFLFLVGLLWGGAFFFASIAVREIAPLTLVLLRVAMAAVALNLYLLLRGRSILAALPMARDFLGLAILNNVIPFSLMFLGQTAIGAGLAAVLNATTPFWTVIFANALTEDEKFSTAKLAGIGLGIAGTVVMIGPGLVAGLGGPAWAKFALIGTAMSYACAAIFARRFRNVAPATVATGQLTASTLVMFPLVLLTGGLPLLSGVSAGAWAAVTALALASTAFAYILFFRILARAGATNASLVTMLVPASAILLGVIFLGERLAPFEIAGMVLVALGLIVIDGRLLSRRRR